MLMNMDYSTLDQVVLTFELAPTAISVNVNFIPYAKFFFNSNMICQLFVIFLIA